MKIESKYFWQAEAKELVLIDNTQEGATTSGCISGINAFYYDTSNQPLGWLQLNSLQVKKFHKSKLLDGFVYVKDGGFQISEEKPEKASFGHQSGPLLIFNYQFLIFKLDNTIRDRRSVAIQTEDNQAVFAYFEETTLAELPQKILDLGKKEGFVAKNAINLDGGSSASFWTENTQVNPRFFSGGWWCEKRLI